MRGRPRLVGGVSSLLIVAASSLASAEPATWQECADAYKDAQTLRKEGHPIRARAKLEICAQATCPAAARKDCGAWIDEVSLQIPTVVPEARGAAGEDVLNGNISLDGVAVAPADRGKAIEVEPGEHIFWLDVPGEQRVEQRVVVAVGDKARRVVLRLAPKRLPTPRPEPLPYWPIILGGGLGFAGMALGIGSTVRADNAATESRSLGLQGTSCSPPKAGFEAQCNHLETLVGEEETYTNTAIGGFVTGGVLLLGAAAYTIVMLVTAPGREQKAVRVNGVFGQTTGVNLVIDL